MAGLSAAARARERGAPRRGLREGGPAGRLRAPVERVRLALPRVRALPRGVPERRRGPAAGDARGARRGPRLARGARRAAAHPRHRQPAHERRGLRPRRPDRRARRGGGPAPAGRAAHRAAGRRPRDPGHRRLRRQPRARARHVTPHADGLRLRATPHSTRRRAAPRPGGRRHAVGRDGRVLRPQPARPAGRIGEAEFRGAQQLYARHATVRNARGEAYAVRTWSEIDVVQWTARQPGARAFYEVADAALDERVRERTVREMIEAAEAAGGPVEHRDGSTVVEVVPAITTTLGGLAIDRDGRVADGRPRRRQRRRRLVDRRLHERPRRRAGAGPAGRRRRARSLLMAGYGSAPLGARRRGGAPAGRPSRPTRWRRSRPSCWRTLEVERGEAKHDLYGALVEIATPVCRNAAEAGEALRALRARVNAAAARHGAALLGAGIHPDGDVRGRRAGRPRALPHGRRRRCRG